ncbi:MAG TPA: sugar transporter [Gammaproteobacteria bacterium]|nr:sugar transporter [Gammaproteobacteria bacterium]HBK13539.1 sugar transporter [Gammaproteobacteria bacterium]
MSSMRVGLGNKLAYGFGSVAFGVKNNGFDYFLLFFYSQVMGVSASLVSTALAIALVFDAISDPLIGFFSDNTRTRWGRRHPYMYSAAVPVTLCYFFLWNPPGQLSGDELFPFLVAISVLVRTLITVYEIPSSALVAEMTDDYDERTSLLSYRFFFGWSGGTIMATVATLVLLVPTADISDGMFNIAGYQQMGFVAAGFIFVAIMVSALGTHRLIPNLKAPPPKRELSIRTIYREIFDTLATRSFAALFLSAMCGAVATGMVASLAYLLYTFLWGFTAQQIGYISASVVISAVLALLISPMISKTLGKKRGAIAVGILAFTVNPAPIVLRLFDLMPENGDPILFPLYLGIIVVDVALIIVYQTLGSSMIADLVEDAEVRTNKRSEGVFFASVTFIRKTTQGIGVVAAGLLLTYSEFPEGVTPDQVPVSVVHDLATIYVPVVILLWSLMILCISMYQVDRTKHEENLQTLGRG